MYPTRHLAPDALDIDYNDKEPTAYTMTTTPAEALVDHLETCRKELDILDQMVDLLHDYHDPERVDWDLVGSYQHLAGLLTMARQFIRDEEE